MLGVVQTKRGGAPIMVLRIAIETIIASVLESSCSAACKVAVISLIEASNGLSQTVRIVIDSQEDQTPTFIDDYKAMLKSLNGQIADLGHAGEFRLNYEDKLYFLWYSHDGAAGWQQAEKEVDDLTGKDFHLAVRILPGAIQAGVSADSVSMDPSNKTELRPTLYCSPFEALAIVMKLHQLMPDMKVSWVLPEEITGERVNERILSLLRSNDDHRHIKEGT